MSYTVECQGVLEFNSFKSGGAFRIRRGTAPDALIELSCLDVLISGDVIIRFFIHGKRTMQAGSFTRQDSRSKKNRLRSASFAFSKGDVAKTLSDSMISIPAHRQIFMKQPSFRPFVPHTRGLANPG